MGKTLTSSQNTLFYLEKRLLKSLYFNETDTTTTPISNYFEELEKLEKSQQIREFGSLPDIQLEEKIKSLKEDLIHLEAKWISLRFFLFFSNFWEFDWRRKTFPYKQIVHCDLVYLLFFNSLMQQFLAEIKKLWFFWIIVIVIWIGWALFRLNQYQWNEIPLGYDAGLYRWIAMAYEKIWVNWGLSELPNWIKHEPLRGTFSVIVTQSWVSLDWLLTLGFALISILVAWLIFLLGRRYDLRVWILSASLFLVWIVPYQAFVLLYFKQILGIILILACILLFEKKKYFIALPFLIALVLIHRNATLYFYAMIFFFMTFELLIHRRIDKFLFAIVAGSGVIGLILYGPLLQKLVLEFITPLLTTYGAQGYQGVFFSLNEFIWFEFVLLVASIGGSRYMISKKNFDRIWCGFLVGAIWTFSGLLNFKRTMIFFDIFLVLVAAIGLWRLWNWKKIWAQVVICLVFAIQIIFLVWFTTDEPSILISPELFASIKALPEVVPENGVVFIANSIFTPRVVWYSQRNWIAPGLSDLNKRNYDWWMLWWQADGKKKCELMKEYDNLGSGLWLWLPIQDNDNLSWQNCLTLIDEKLWARLYHYSPSHD